MRAEQDTPSVADATTEVPAGLIYTNDAVPGIARLKRGKGFSYRRHDGRAVRDSRELKRIRGLAIPPAYREVWICPMPNGHLQATGLDARGRKQYRYHPLWRTERDAGKFGRMQQFALALPRIRKRVARTLCGNEHGREELLAAVARLLDTTSCRIGNVQYARENGSFGLCTLRSRHVTLQGNRVELDFRGKSGVVQKLQVEDACLARVLANCLALRGSNLFRYRDEAGKRRGIVSSDVNEWLHDVAGSEFSAKDFRTWHATVLGFKAITRALQSEEAKPRFTLKTMLAEVAEVLGNTPAVCRKSYVHPRVIELAQLASARPDEARGKLQPPLKAASRKPSGLRKSERELLAFLQAA